MDSEYSNKDWIIELGVRPNQMKPIDPPGFVDEQINENDRRLFSSIYSMTLAECLISHNIEDYLLEHIQIEKDCSKQDDLTIAWSDEVSLTLCFLASLAHHGDYSQDHLLERFFQWWMNGYMCPTGLCFTPRVHIKKSIDLFGETQACHALGIEVDLSKKTSTLFPTGASLLRISPIAYFYSKHSNEKRRKILEDCVGRMFGKHTSLDVFNEYLNLLVNSLNGLSKQSILSQIQFKSNNSNDSLNQIFIQLIDLLTHDENDIQHGIQLALKHRQIHQDHYRYFNPYDSDQTILLTLYLQISGAIYNIIPNNSPDEFYAKMTIQSLIKWIIYQRNVNLHSIE